MIWPMVIQSLQRPMSPPALAAAVGALTVLVAAYCLVYTALAGSPESLSEAVSWPLVNLVPWLFAFEYGKRQAGWARKGVVLVAALAISLLLGAPSWRAFTDAGFQLVRSLPALLATGVALYALARAGSAARRSQKAVELPCSPQSIEWVAAASNYVELHGAFGTLLVRAPLSQVERELAPAGFVRAHRSALVRVECIARRRPKDVLLKSGRSIPLGKRFRAPLDAAISSLRP